MKLIITEGKQVGEVSYMVSSLETLINILSDEKILRSRLAELNPDTHKKQYYLSLSRNLTSAGNRNSKRWRFGVILDGDKLSDHYSITPVSYSGIQMTYSDLRVKWIAAYDNDTYALNLVNWTTIPISKNLYNLITAEIDNMPEDLKQKKKLQHSGVGRNVVNGRKLKEKYLFNVKTGGLKLNYKKYPEICVLLSKNENVNETEERIWIPTDKPFISIHNCIKGVIIPKTLTTEEKEEYLELEQILKTRGITNILNY